MSLCWQVTGCLIYFFFVFFGLTVKSPCNLVLVCCTFSFPFLILFPSCRYGLSPGCRAGTFGPKCKSRCSCINGGRCDFRTGTCYCPPGFIGADCSSSKSGNLAPVFTPEWKRLLCFCTLLSSLFGITYLGMLVISASVLYWKILVNHDWGKPQGLWNYIIYHFYLFIIFDLCCCVNEDMFISTGCPSGYYGKDCAKLCSCGEGGQCHPATGKCICAPGRMGQSCQQGLFGLISSCGRAMTRQSLLFMN